MPLFPDLTPDELVDLVYKLGPEVPRTVIVYMRTCPACKFTLGELDTVDLSGTAVGTIEVSDYQSVINALDSDAQNELNQVLASRSVPHFARFGRDGVTVHDGAMNRAELQSFLFG